MPDNCRHIPKFVTKDERVCRLCGKKFGRHEVLTPEEIAALLGAEPPTKKRFVVTGGLGAFFLSWLKR
ncbi:MAG: hypothetical protein WC473_02030 [Patescibacteria group bacterium]|jgi:RNA polymerase subunit RPABC4/transcription elongation factor Spt4